MFLVVASLLVLANDPAGAPPPPPPDAKKAAPQDPPGEDPTEPAPIAPRKGGPSDAPKPDPKGKPGAAPPNRLLAAGIAAGVTCLAGPSIWCCSSGILCAWLPCLLTPGIAAGGAAAGLAASGGEMSPVPIGAAVGVGAGGALVAALIGIPATFLISGAGQGLGGPTSPNAQVLNLGWLAVWTAIAGVVSVGTAAGVGAAVYFLMPDGSGDASGGKDAKGTVEARGEPEREPSRRVAMAY